MITLFANRSRECFLAFQRFRRRGLRLAPVLVSLFVAGCAAHSPESRAPELEGSLAPADWAEDTSDSSSRERVAADWIESFDSVELERIVDATLARNFRLQAGSFQAQAAEAAARIANAARWPNLSLNLNSGKQSSRFSALDFRQFSTEVHNLSLNTQWEIDLWGRLSLSAQSAQAQAEAAEIDYQAAKLSLAGQSSKAYFNAIAAGQLERLARTNRDLLARRYEAVERRFDRGVADAAELQSAEASLAGAEANLESRTVQRDAAVRTLETLMAEYPDGNLDLSSELPKSFPTVPAGLPANLLSRRPDLAAEERRLTSTYLDSESAQRNWLPRIALTGSAGTTSNQLVDLLDDDFSVWSVFGDLTANLFSAGRLSAQREQARAQAEAALLNFKESALQAFREVENALGAEAALARLEAQQAKSARAFAESERRIESLYEKGTVDLFTLIDARARTVDAQTRLIESANRRLQNRIDLYLALGGGFEAGEAGAAVNSQS